MSELQFPVKNMPWRFLICRRLGRRKWFGVYRAMRIMLVLGLFNCVARFPLRNGAMMHVPLYREDSWWDEEDVWNYSRELIDVTQQLIHRMIGPVLLIDCGADIGVVSVLLASQEKNVREVIAFEPNPVAHAVLNLNLKALKCQTRAEESGVGAVPGRGTLRSPSHDRSDHARFVVPGQTGDFPIVRLDDLGVPTGRDVVIKIDVEGGEMDVIRGASALLHGARSFIIAFEAHPVQTERTGGDAVDIIKAISEIRECRTVVAEAPQVSIAGNTPFFDQLGQRRICNVICHAGLTI